MASRVGKYLLFETLGEGAFGKVKLGVHEETGEQVAVKIMDKSDIKAQEMTINVRRKIAIMKALKHRNIVNLRQVLTSHTKLYIVMDLVTGGELFTNILDYGRFEESVARRCFQQLVDGIDYCHKRGVCHRDLKLENLLIDEATGGLKITGFGLSAMKGASTTKELLHTQRRGPSPNYCAPEIIARSKQGYSGTKVDAWSCGIILFVLLAGFLPFYDESTKVLYNMIRYNDVKFPRKFPSQARDLVLCLLHKDPEKRFTLAHVKKHSWFAVGYVGDDAPAPVVAGMDLPPRPPPFPAPVIQIGAADETRRPIAPQPMKDDISTRDVPSKERLTAALARYRRTFKLGNKIGITSSPSFISNKGTGPGDSSGDEDPSKIQSSGRSNFFARAKTITGAWGIILTQELEEDSDSVDDTPQVTEDELKAFSRLLDFWDNRRASASVPSGGEVLLDDENSSPLSEADILSIQSLLQKLESKEVEDEMTEVVNDVPMTAYVPTHGMGENTVTQNRDDLEDLATQNVRGSLPERLSTPPVAQDPIPSTGNTHNAVTAELTSQSSTTAPPPPPLQPQLLPPPLPPFTVGRPIPDLPCEWKGRRCGQDRRRKWLFRHP